MKRRNFLKFAAVSGAAAIPSALNAASQNADKISQNKAAMKRFEKAINSADAAALKELVDPKSAISHACFARAALRRRGVLCSGKDDAR